MGREEEARARALHTAIDVGIREGRLAPRDRFTRPIREGDQVLYRSTVDLVFTVKSVVPNMDPRATQPVVILTLVAEVPLQVPVGQPVINLVNLGPKPSPDGVTGTGTPTGPVSHGSTDRDPEEAPRSGDSGVPGPGQANEPEGGTDGTDGNEGTVKLPPTTEVDGNKLVSVPSDHSGAGAVPSLHERRSASGWLDKPPV